MKKYVQRLLFIAALGFANNLPAQSQGEEITCIIKSDKYSVNAASKVIQLQGNVALTFGRLKVVRADKVTIDEKANKIIVFGCYECSFEGRVVANPAVSDKVTVEYTKGESMKFNN